MKKRELRRSRIVAVWIASLVTLGLAHISGAQELTARVDRVRVAQNETLSLEVIYADRVDTSAIDFEALLPDFSILSNIPSSQTRIVNFKRSSQTSWQLVLMPKRTGRIRIPSFQVEGATSTPIDVVVSAAPRSPEAGAIFSARLEVDRETAFVGEQILIRITLSAARGIADLRGPALDVSNADTALVNQSEFQRVVGGSTYHVTELTYAVFAQSPGEISIPSLQYTGRRQRSRVVVAQTEVQKIFVLDPAADPEASERQPWLPANGIAISNEWSGPTDELAVGEPITRTIRIAAASQRAAAITPLSLPAGPYKQYAEQPVIEDKETPTGILGRRSDAIVIVPTEPGELRLPAIEVDWWNIDKKRWEVARIPPETLVVAASASAASPSTPSQPPATDIPPVSPPDLSAPSSPKPDRWTLALGGLSMILAIACIFLFLRVRKLEAIIGASASASPARERAEAEDAAYRKAIRSLTLRDAKAARAQILAWARLRWRGTSSTGLDSIVGKTGSPAFERAFASLDARLYGVASANGEGSDGDFDFEGLKNLLEDLHSRARGGTVEESSSLGSLYPNESDAT